MISIDFLFIFLKINDFLSKMRPFPFAILNKKFFLPPASRRARGSQEGPDEDESSEKNVCGQYLIIS